MTSFGAPTIADPKVETKYQDAKAEGMDLEYLHLGKQFRSENLARPTCGPHVLPLDYFAR